LRSDECDERREEEHVAHAASLSSPRARRQVPDRTDFFAASALTSCQVVRLVSASQGPMRRELAQHG
jgi:hypothetical protein